MIRPMKPRSSLRTCVCAGVFLAASSGSASAYAQDASGTPPPVASTSPGAPNPGPSEERMADARRQFEAGVSLLEDPDGAKYEDAYRAFKKAYELSQSPKVLGNIAFCALHLERDGEAVDSYATYLRDVPDVSERERAQIQRDLATMMATMARVRVVVKTATPGSVIVDRRTQTRGQVVENAYPLESSDLVLRLRPGRHSLFVRTGATESVAFDVTLEPGSQTTFTPQAQARKEERPGAGPAARSITGPIIVGGAGLVAIGVGIATGIVARGKTNDIEKSCPNNLCPTSYNLADARTSAKTFGTIADVSFIGGSALIGGALVWYLLSPQSSSSQKTTGSTAAWKSWRPTAMCSHDGCGFNMGRGF